MTDPCNLTPSPWRVNGHIVEGDVGKGGKQTTVAQVCTNDADRHLIAAAPYLIAACEEPTGLLMPTFLEWLTDRLVCVYGESPNTDFVIALRKKAAMEKAAIAKARPTKGDPPPC